MGRLAKPIDALIAGPAQAFDVLIVGSGYGGSVAARRSAEAGLVTAVLERGREYVPGDFPRDTAIAPGAFRIDTGGDTVSGYDDALFDMHVGAETVVLSGNGLGGGSLINAGVAVAPDPEVFAQDAWPRAIRSAPHAIVELCDRAADALHAMEYLMDPCSGVRPKKTLAFEQFAAEATHDLANARITVNTSRTPVDVPGGQLQPCTGCGDCVSGCNYGAKATLTETYLAEAYKQNASLFVNASVLRVARDGSRWRVTYTRTTDQRAYQRAQARLAGNLPKEERQQILDLIKVLEHEITVGVVVLAAGALGSTEILQRSRHAGLATSRTLGSRFSGNGDYLSFGYWQRDEVRAVGWGSTGDRHCPPQATADGHPPAVGPTITRIARFRDRERLAGSFIVEDAAVPGALSDIFHELVTSAAVLHQLPRWSFKGKDPIARAKESVRHTQVFLTMGHDGSRGSLVLGRNQRVRVDWPTLDADANFAAYDARMKVVEHLDALYLPNPVWTPIPPAMEKVLSGARFRGRNAIVHPLGGCPMADDGYHGTVNDVGAVFATSSGDTVHRGLFVLDGAIVPTSLGANPLLTITALAERAMPAVIAAARARDGAATRDEATPRATRHVSPSALAEFQRTPRQPVPIAFREVLRGTLRRTDGRRAAPLNARLDVTLPAADVRDFLDDPKHRFEAARATLQLSPLRADCMQQSQLATWRYAEAQGSVTILEQYGHAWRLLDCMRVLLTWLIERGANEIAGAIRGSVARLLHRFACRLQGRSAPNSADRPGAGLPGLVLDTLRLAWHAAERRRMVYCFDFKLASQTCAIVAEVPTAPETIILRGGKDVQYAASWRALSAYLARRLAFVVVRALQVLLALARMAPREATWMRPPRLARRNLWRSMTELDVHLREPNLLTSSLVSGSLHMAPVEMLDERPPQVHGEATSGLLGLGGYPLLFARYLLKCRLWDFRLPEYTRAPRFDYPRAPGVGAARRVHVDQRLPPLRDAEGKWSQYPEAYALDVEGPTDATGAPTTLPLVLWRYRNRIGTGTTHDGAIQCRSILLVHAFAQSAISFAEPTLHENLAEHLHREGWDVWLLEHRISIGLTSALDQCSMDDIARVDIRSAVQRCLKEIKSECDVPEAAPLQMYALAQCVGSAALAMAVLSGGLRIPNASPKPVPRHTDHENFEAREPSLLAGVVFSQFTPCVIGAAGSQFRSFLPTVLRDVFGVRSIDFAAPAQIDASGCEDEGARALSGQTDTLIDRLLATLGREEAEHCWDEYQGRGATQVHASCRRMAGIEAPLFMHANLAPATHDRLPLLLGVSNIGVFAHARRCVEQERLVDADGLNVYLSTDHIQQHLHMPVAFLHGERNALFSVGSSRLSHAMVKAAFPVEHANARAHLCVFPQYGHLDWLIGKDAAKDCYPRVVCFLRSAWRTNETSSCNAVPKADRELPLALLQVPALGPLLGAVRRKEDGSLEANVWMRPHERGSAPPEFVVVEYMHAGASLVSVWPIQEMEVIPQAELAAEAAAGALPDPRVRYAVVQLCIPALHLPEDGSPLRLQMFSLHPFPGWRDFISTRIQGPLEGFLQLQGHGGAPPMSPHPDPCESWRRVLIQIVDGERVFDHCRSRIETRLRKLRYRVERTARSTLSRRLLKPESLADATLELRRTFVQPPDRRTTVFLATNCRYPGFAVEQHRIDATYRRLLERECRTRVPASALLLVGDQIYADVTAGLFDMQTPIEKYDDRYRGWLEAPAVRSVVRSIPTYMAIDDHEIDDDWDRSQTVLDPPLASIAIAMARVFQWSHSSAASLPLQVANKRAAEAGLVHDALLGGTIPALFLDTRSLRNRRRSPSRIITDTAWDMLEAWLKTDPTRRVPKVIVTGSPIAPGLAVNVDGKDRLDPYAAATSDNWQCFDGERRKLFDLIVASKAEDVVLLSGDYHCSAVAQVHMGNKRVATAILAPPAYAPFDYANSRAAALSTVEHTAGYEIRIARDAEDKLVREDGSGYVRLAYDSATQVLDIDFHLWDVVAGAEPGTGGWRLRKVAIDFAKIRAGQPMETTHAQR